MRDDCKDQQIRGLTSGLGHSDEWSGAAKSVTMSRMSGNRLANPDADDV
jgi:hypothetical protein